MLTSKAAGMALTLVTLTAGCAAPGSDPAAPLATVPAGCDIAAAGVRWGPLTEEPRLTQVTLFRGAASGAGEEVLREPFTSTVTGVAAPDGWPATLAASLSEPAGAVVRTGTAVTTKDGGYSMSLGAADDPAITESVLYQSAQTVTATFTVGCATPVTGTFAGWTVTSVGAVHCGQADPPADPAGRLARAHCPRTSAPRPSEVPEARPFDAVPGTEPFDGGLDTEGEIPADDVPTPEEEA